MPRENITDRRSRTPNRGGDRRILSEGAFRKMLTLEQVRSERTQRPFALAIVQVTCSPSSIAAPYLWPVILAALRTTTRESDVTGWIERDSAVGILLTEVIPDGGLQCVRSRISSVLQSVLGPEHFSLLRFDMSLQPETLRPAAHAADKQLHLVPDLRA
jgi:hypothetical protein